ncbi:MAG: DegT/DnrJ/EryC1/StrS family aminotransferase [Chitinophagaceae bacterium]|nr:DegT/DnrJ/EryC1/StrS family aminotransferase [Chitinophagaceae bacterium]
MIQVTQPFLPPVEEFQAYVKQIWDRNWLTNNGPLVNELELKLKERLGADHLLYLNNGTIALQIAIKALDLKGEIITTPFSYVATTSSIVWEGCTPVFADIDPSTLNIDPSSIEAAITGNTSAIIATHTYGNPCDIDAIQAIADRHKLKVIYDAAHCFGTLYKGKSVYLYGDVSTASFHATKLFHTIEGGAVFTKDPELLKKMAYMRNFGHNGPEDFAYVGINGKNSEFHAAMGLVNLKYVDANAESRENQFHRYNIWMKHLRVQNIILAKETKHNYSYYPIIFESEEAVLKAVEMLNAHLIYPRRYFYPSLNNLNYVTKGETPVCDSIAPRVLCLPMYYNLSMEEIDLICRLLLRIQNN